MGLMESILLLLAGCGVFMTGMKLMSDGLERSAGKGMRKLFGRISNNRFAGVGIGAGVTAIIQSSSATTVMVIGFVNAGIMTLFQATSIIMGANIGTTVTGIIISFSAFDISWYAMALTLVGVLIMMFTKSDTAKKIGGVLTGLGLIFVGLELMGNSLKGNEQISAAFSFLFQKIDFPLFLIFFGVIFTALIQSSSAATGLIITMVAEGVLPMNQALFVVLGTNIGTCITAIIAAVGASNNAKRAALIHLTFNVIGTTMFAAFLWIFSKYIIIALSFFIPTPAMQIAWFHVFFNLITTGILLPFIRPLTKFAELVIKDKGTDENVLKLYYIDDRILHTPPIAVAQVLKEVTNMADIAKDNLGRAFKALINSDISEKDKIFKEEEKLNFINKGIARYLIKMASLNLSTSDDKLIGSLHHVISDIERIGDHAENFSEYAADMIDNKISFSTEAVEELTNMYCKVHDMFTKSMSVFESRDTTRFKEISDIENEIDLLKRQLGNNHIIRLNSGNCTVESGTHFYAVISALERVADHLTNVTFSIRSPSGSQREAMAKIAKEKKVAPKKTPTVIEKTKEADKKAHKETDKKSEKKDSNNKPKN